MRYGLLLILCLIALPFTVFADQPASLVGLQIEPSPTASRFIFILTKKTYGRVKYLPQPDRLIVEFVNTVKNFNLQNAKLGGSNVKSINSETEKHNKLRFVFYVDGKVKWLIHFLPQRDGVRLQLDIISIKPAIKKIRSKMIKPVVHQSNNKKKNTLIAQQITRPSPAKRERVFTIVIDAGHGGKDTGALGFNGTAEKNVVLSIAKILAKEINQQPYLHAILTRDGDYFVPLRERLKLARKGNADLFVAIHADSYFNNHATGASVYALSQRGATSEAARWLARRDNYSELDGVEFDALQDRSSMLRSVLIDLAQTATIQDSLRLGNKVLDALDNVSSLHYSHVEQAPFVVLKSPDIPSILVETGFISNPQEEKRLANPKYQQKIAQALWQGIHQYIRQYAANE